MSDDTERLERVKREALMPSELVRRLRVCGGNSHPLVCDEAADYIEALERELAAARDAVGALREALDLLLRCSLPHDVSGQAWIHQARQTFTDTVPAAAEWRARRWQEGWMAGRDAAAKAIVLLPGDMPSMIGRPRAIDAIEALEPPEAPEEP